MITLDAWILKRCTSFAHWFQRLTGRTNFFLAKCGVVIVLLSVLTDLANYWNRILTHETSLSSLFITFYLVISTSWRGVKYDQADEHVLSGKTTLPSWVHGVRMAGPYFRILVLGLIFAIDVPGFLEAWPFAKHIWLEALHSMFFVGYSISLYFVAVDPEPPGMSKVREWLNSFGFGARQAPVPVENS